MSQTARLAMISRRHRPFSIVAQYGLLKVPRLTLYCKPKPVSDDDLSLMHRIDEIYMKWPFYGSRRMVEALRDERCKPKIFNTDRGSQFTSCHFTGLLAKNGVAISMDCKGRFLDNIFIERLWCSLKYEEIFLKAYGSVAEARLGINAWMKFYNDERKHPTLGYQTPREIFAASTTFKYVHNASALNTCPQAPQSQTKKNTVYAGKVIPSDFKLLAA